MREEGLYESVFFHCCYLLFVAVVKDETESSFMSGNFYQAQDHFGSAVDTQLGADMGDMCPCGVIRDPAFFCDLVVIQTDTDQLCDLGLPGCQVKAIFDVIPLPCIEHNTIIISDTLGMSA